MYLEVVPADEAEQTQTDFLMCLSFLLCRISKLPVET